MSRWKLLYRTITLLALVVLSAQAVVRECCANDIEIWMGTEKVFRPRTGEDQKIRASDDLIMEDLLSPDQNAPTRRLNDRAHQGIINLPSGTSVEERAKSTLLEREWSSVVSAPEAAASFASSSPSDESWILSPLPEIGDPGLDRSLSLDTSLIMECIGGDLGIDGASGWQAVGPDDLPSSPDLPASRDGLIRQGPLPEVVKHGLRPLNTEATLSGSAVATQFDSNAQATQSSSGLPASAVRSASLETILYPGPRIATTEPQLLDVASSSVANAPKVEMAEPGRRQPAASNPSTQNETTPIAPGSSQAAQNLDSSEPQSSSTACSTEDVARVPTEVPQTSAEPAQTPEPQMVYQTPPQVVYQMPPQVVYQMPPQVVYQMPPQVIYQMPPQVIYQMPPQAGYPTPSQWANPVPQVSSSVAPPVNNVPTPEMASGAYYYGQQNSTSRSDAPNQPTAGDTNATERMLVLGLLIFAVFLGAYGLRWERLQSAGREVQCWFRRLLPSSQTPTVDDRSTTQRAEMSEDALIARVIADNVTIRQRLAGTH